jgi:hypothetical protein
LCRTERPWPQDIICLEELGRHYKLKTGFMVADTAVSVFVRSGMDDDAFHALLAEKWATMGEMTAKCVKYKEAAARKRYLSAVQIVDALGEQHCGVMDYTECDIVMKDNHVFHKYVDAIHI